jgi:hypothetical protein
MNKAPDFEGWLSTDADPNARANLAGLWKQRDSAKARDKADADEHLRLIARHRDVVDRELAIARKTDPDRTRVLAEEAEQLASKQRVQAQVREASETIAHEAEQAARKAEQPLRAQHGALLVQALVTAMDDGFLPLCDQYLEHYREFRRIGGNAYPIPADGLAREILKLISQRRGVALQG